MMSALLADIRLAVRTLRKNRGFAAVGLLTIALGVGANAAVFSVVNALLIDPLPYANPDRLVAVFETARRPSVERRAVSYPNFRDWQREARSFEAMSVILGERFTMTIGDAPERFPGEMVSGGYFDLLGVRPARGRGLTAQDDAPGAAPVVVISDAFWQRTFGGDPQILGRALTINGESSTVVGVMPAGFGGIVDNPTRQPAEDVALFAGYLAVTAAVMLSACLLACIGPARRALRINPTEALREA